jgi:DNA-binding GntR family transcriptional regulator
LIVVSDVPSFEPDTEGPEYIYVQLANYVQALIEAGELRPGARLPAERTMAEEYGVAYLTVRRAMMELRERNLIQTVIGRGTFIARRDEETED